MAGRRIVAVEQGSGTFSCGPAESIVPRNLLDTRILYSRFLSSPTVVLCTFCQSYKRYDMWNSNLLETRSETLRARLPLVRNTCNYCYIRSRKGTVCLIFEYELIAKLMLLSRSLFSGRQRLVSATAEADGAWRKQRWKPFHTESQTCR
jgi:hypothetical protein